MDEITLKGTVYRGGQGSNAKKVVFIDPADHSRMKVWWMENHIDTKLGFFPHPVTKRPCPQISAETIAQNMPDGQDVLITIVTKLRKRAGLPHMGIKTLAIVLDRGTF